jgi:hypothetical protein
LEAIISHNIFALSKANLKFKGEGKMKKTVASIVLGIALSAPAVYAVCDDLIVVGTTYCELIGSTVVNGVEVCRYKCHKAETPVPVPAPETPPAAN